MINMLVRISYDGTAYSGFQIQENASTIQGELERALSVIYRQPLRITGAGRTDSGVHARGQAAGFRAPFLIEPEKIPHAINSLLPHDIVVTEASVVPDQFHARFDAQRKLYSYTLDRSPFPQVLRRLYSWHCPEKLDLDLIRAAARLFPGIHDFKYFQAAGMKIDNTCRTIHRIDVTEYHSERILVFKFEGEGFLYRMVRMITGTLVRSGRGQLELNEIESALAGKSRTAAGPTAPAHGLCLEEVIY